MEDPKETIVAAGPKASVRSEVGERLLVVIHGDELGRKYDLAEARTIVGRAPESDIQLDEEDVSRAHAQFVNRDGGIYLVDLQSTNGTSVNDKALSGPRLLGNGDLISIGRTIFKFIAGNNIEASYHAEVYRLTTVDGLTQVFNRRTFDELLAREVSRCRRHGRNLSLVMMDVDRFKVINDRYGHFAGDHVLKHLAGLLRDYVRREDVFARYGGEEFALLLPELDAPGAVLVAEKIRTRIEAEPFTCDGHTVPVTLSLGVATLSPQASEPADLVKLADGKLYEAKTAGRNVTRA